MTDVTGIKLKSEKGKLNYEFYPIEFSLADKKKILQGVVSCIPIKTNGKILLIKRSENNYLYANHNGLPAGHIDFGIKPEEAALTELKEETNLSPLASKRIFEDKIFVDEFGHFPFVYLFIIDEKENLVFDTHEINPKEGGFKYVEEIVEKLNTENFTPLSRMILLELIKKFPNTRKVKEYIKKIQNNIE